MPNIPFSLDEDEKRACEILRYLTPKMATRSENTAERRSEAGSKGYVTNDTDYESIEIELDTSTMILCNILEEREGAGVAKRIEDHMKDIGFHLSYLAEGGANVIFKIELSGAEHIPLLHLPIQRRLQALQGMLLRVRKQVGADTRSSWHIMDEYEQRIRPLFPAKYLLRQMLIRLPIDITIVLQKMLVAAEQEGIRPLKRRGERLVPQTDQELFTTAGLPTEDHGILVQDLSPQVHTEHLLEFKPKWLMRSWKTTSKRCRTCALREMRRADGTSPGRGDSNFCPLDLLSGKSSTLRPALHRLWNIDELRNANTDDSDPDEAQDAGSGSVNSHVASTCGSPRKSRAEIFETEFRHKVQPLLGRLKSLQAVHSQVSMDDFNRGSDEDVSLAMALRDCSVFVKVEATQEKVKILYVKLADLDLKAANRGKREKWMEMERRLVDEGWYDGKLAPGMVEDEVICWVSRSCT